MKSLSLKLIFPISRSKNFGRVVNLAREFDDFKPGNQNIVSIDREEELLEKWEFFNVLYWTIIDWKGSIVEYDGQRYQGHYDKTRIFYAFQREKQQHINDAVVRIKEIRRIFDYTFYSRLNDLKILN